MTKDSCILCGRPDSDTVPVTFGAKKKLHLLPVCDPCIINPNLALHTPGLKLVVKDEEA